MKVKTLFARSSWSAVRCESVTQEEKDSQYRGLLEYLNYQSHELPLRYNSKAPRVGQFISNEKDAVELIDVWEAPGTRN